MFYTEYPEEIEEIAYRQVVDNQRHLEDSKCL